MFDTFAYDFHEELYQKHGKVARIYGLFGVGNELHGVSRSVAIMGP
jgi:hypothetical protein